MLGIKGPPQAWFSVPGQPRIVYFVLGLMGRNPNALVQKLHETMEEIENYCEVHFDNPVMYWRMEPTLEVIDPMADDLVYKLVCRLQTCPPIPEEVYRQFLMFKPEGQAPNELFDP